MGEVNTDTTLLPQALQQSSRSAALRLCGSAAVLLRCLQDELVRRISASMIDAGPEHKVHGLSGQTAGSIHVHSLPFLRLLEGC